MGRRHSRHITISDRIKIRQEKERTHLMNKLLNEMVEQNRLLNKILFYLAVGEEE